MFSFFLLFHMLWVKTIIYQLLVSMLEQKHNYENVKFNNIVMYLYKSKENSSR